MKHTYFQGIKIAKSSDGVHFLPDTETQTTHPVAALVGQHEGSPTALVVGHLNPDGSHERHVIALGYRDRASAMDDHRRHFPGARLGAVQAVPVETLRASIDRNAPVRIGKRGQGVFLRLGPVAKSDYERVDPRTGKVEHVHDSRVRRVVTEHRDGGSSRFDYGIRREAGGHRIVMRMAAGHGGREHAGEWESAMMGGLHGSADEAHKKLGQALAQAHRHQGSQVEYHDGDAQRHFDAALTEHRRREAADAKARAEAETRHQRESERRAQLDLDASTAKFRKVKFRMHVLDGEPEDVEGWGIGGLVVHRVGEGRYAKYRVSHVGTGKTLGVGVRDAGRGQDGGLPHVA